MLELLGSFLSGTLVRAFGDSVLAPIVGYLNKKTDADTEKFKEAVGDQKEVVLAQLKANLDVYQARIGLIGGMKTVKWLIFLAILPPVIHSGAVYLDSTFCNDIVHTCTRLGVQLGMPWHVPKAPAPYDEREWTLIASLLGIQTGVIGITSALPSVLRWLHK